MFQFLIGRLVTQPRRFQCRGGVLFQFLIGRLVTLKDVDDLVPDAGFQFLIGRLVTIIFNPIYSNYNCFNSS